MGLFDVVASNLRIAYPDIPFRAIATASANTWDAFWDYRNTLGGPRYLYGSCTAGTSGAVNIEYDLGTGITSTVDYIIVGRADKLRTDGATSLILSAGGSLGGAYAAKYTNASFNTATLYGPRANDFIATGLGVAAYRAFNLAFSGGGVSTRTMAGVYFGNAFDMGVNPNYEHDKIPAKESTFYAGSGAAVLHRVDEPVYRISLSWRGVTDAKVIEYQNTITRAAQIYGRRFFLYTTAVHSILDNQRLLNVGLVSTSAKKSKRAEDWNDITATFEEILG